MKEARMECITRNIDLDKTRSDWPPVEGWFRINCAPRQLLPAVDRMVAEFSGLFFCTGE